MDAKSLIRLGWVVCVLGFVLSSLASAQVVFQETFEVQTYAALKGWREHGGCWDHSFAIVQDPCSKSIDNRVVKITNIMGKDNRSCNKAVFNKSLPGNPSAFKHRTELMPDSEKARARPGEDFWVGMRTFVDKAYPSGNDLINFHASQIIPDVNDSGTDMALQIDKRGNWDFSVRHQRKFNMSIERGKWTNWVIHYKRSTKKDGLVEVWKDEKKLVDFQGVTSQNEEERGLWKFGLYRGREVEKEHAGETYVLYFDDVKIAKGPNQFEAVRPDKIASQCMDQPKPPKQPKPPENLRVQEQN